MSWCELVSPRVVLASATGAIKTLAHRRSSAHSHRACRHQSRPPKLTRLVEKVAAWLLHFLLGGYGWARLAGLPKLARRCGPPPAAAAAVVRSGAVSTGSSGGCTTTTHGGVYGGQWSESGGDIDNYSQHGQQQWRLRPARVSGGCDQHRSTTAVAYVLGRQLRLGL
jgi:hypothetical protein